VLVMLVVECRTWAGARKAGREDGEQTASWCRDRVDRLVRLALQSASEVRLCLFGRTMDDATKWALMKEFESTGAETGVPVKVYRAASTVEGKQHPGWPGYIVVMTDDLLPYYTGTRQAEGSSGQESADHMRGHQDHEMGGGYVESMVGLVKRGALADDISASPPATGRLAPCLVFHTALASSPHLPAWCACLRLLRCVRAVPWRVSRVPRGVSPVDSDGQLRCLPVGGAAIVGTQGFLWDRDSGGALLDRDARVSI
jgi:hypothetical protein